MNQYRKAAVLAIRLAALYIIAQTIGDFISIMAYTMTQGATHPFPYLGMAFTSGGKLVVGVIGLYLSTPLGWMLARGLDDGPAH